MIRIRIQENQKHTDPTDPDMDSDPQHWLEIRTRKDYEGRRTVKLFRENPFLATALSRKNTDKLLFVTVLRKSVPNLELKRL
jgi:hypothetical protein